MFDSSGGVIHVPPGEVRGASEIPEGVWDWTWKGKFEPV